jgi:nicotinamidase-related amidase
MAEGLRFGPLDAGTVHVCVDMQRMFAEQTDWHTPWMKRVLPNVMQIAEARAAQTICTRFIPARNASEAIGTWGRYYQRWASMTLDRLPDGEINLVAPLAKIAPPIEVIDKIVYSPWVNPVLEQRLRERRCETVVITGGETDICVLATVLGAVDRGYRVIVVEDALCSSTDEIHEAILTLYNSRFGQQIETVWTDAVMRAWT